ncbi:MAG: phosphoribosylformylglycinamidine synthase, partial [Myxococcota bacterium]
CVMGPLVARLGRASVSIPGGCVIGDRPIDLPLDVLLGKPPRMHRTAQTLPVEHTPIDRGSIDLLDAAERVLALPTVASKGFLITIGDRSITGYVARDQMVGPWQVPVADVATTTVSHDSVVGEAMAMGERTPVAVLDGPAAGRLAVGEALTNLMAAPIRALDRVVLSANWMAPAGHPGEDAKLYETVRAVGMELCPALGLCIPVGKDSMSMRTVWTEDGQEKRVTAPLSLIVSAFSPCTDAGAAWTPQLQPGDTRLIAIDLGQRQNRLGGSALAQVYGTLGAVPPDLDDPAHLRGFVDAMQALHGTGQVLAYHDRSDGGLFATLCEMAFAGHLGAEVDLDDLGDDPVGALFSEELGAVLQVAATDVESVLELLAKHQVFGVEVGTVLAERTLTFRHDAVEVLTGDAVQWHRLWADTSYRMQALRDDPDCAQQEFDGLLDVDDPGISPVLTFDPAVDIAAPFIGTGVRPKVAILREQGVNGQIEMAAAFDRAGFEAVDVHMSDLIAGRRDLTAFKGLVACGGFSYGDVLGAGGGWARTVLFQAQLRAAFQTFFHRGDTFSLGVCNGCQMMSHLAPLIPGAEDWPRFVRNQSEQFEARVCTLEVQESPSILLAGMAGSRLPVAVAHGEGRAFYAENAPQGEVAVRYVDNRGAVTQQYPLNPNGSPAGIAGLTTPDGRATIVMPHPERVFRTVSNSWTPSDWGPDGPWLKMFRNARVWVG